MLPKRHRRRNRWRHKAYLNRLDEIARSPKTFNHKESSYLGVIKHASVFRETGKRVSVRD